MPEPISPTDRIVVGVDGSEGSRSALRWAMDQARMTGGKLEAVAGWQDPATVVYSAGWAAPYDGESLGTVMQKVLDETVAEVSDTMERPVHVATQVVQGHPAQVLTETARGAQLLVVGSRGHGTFAGLVLGSVSQHCVHQAPCPVVVVPQPQPDRA